MLFIEASLFFLFLGGFSMWLLLSDRLKQWREERESRRVADVVSSLQGNPIADVVRRFGPPREQFTGSTGRSLYVWRRPSTSAFPKVTGLFVVTLTVNRDGRVEESAWQRK